MAASVSGSSRVVRAILERGGEVNQIMARTRTAAVHEAAKGGHFEVRSGGCFPRVARKSAKMMVVETPKLVRF